jgi:asparagine synthase (glutamine-hydrolysing)
MPGICGLVSSVSVGDPSALLAEMLRRMTHHPWYARHSYRDPAAGVALGRVALGLVNAAPQPAFNEDRSLVAVMDGEVYDCDQQRAALARAGHRFAGDSQAEVLLHGHESAGQQFFRGLNGRFCAAIWDAIGQRLIVVNDRFGQKPLYYARLPQRLLVASEVKALRAEHELPLANDLRGIAQFFHFGHLFGEDTLLEEVRLLPAAGWLIYDVRADRLTVERYWRLEPRTAAHGSSEERLLDEVDGAFRRAVERRVAGPGRLGLSLSGGLDARTILAVIDHERVPLTTVSLGMEGSIDHRSARALSDLSNRRHRAYLLNTDFLRQFEAHLRHMVHLTDGHYLSQCIIMPTLPVYRELGIDVLLRGHAGELMHMDKAYNFSLDREALALRDEAALAAWLFRHLSTYMVETVDGPLFAPGLQGEMERLARDSLAAALAESAGVEPPVQRVGHLFLSQRLRRETALSMVKFNSLVEPRLPYLDNDLIDVLMALPPQWKLGDRIQSHVLRRHRPAFLNVVNANTGARLGAGRLARLAARARLKVLAKLGVKGYQPYERLGRWLREDLAPLVRRLLLSDRCLGRGLFNPDTVRAVVAGHLDGRRNHTFLLLALLVFEQGRRELTDDESPVEEPLCV